MIDWKKRKARSAAKSTVEAMKAGALVYKNIDDLIAGTKKTRDLFEKEDDHWDHYNVQYEYYKAEKEKAND